MTKEQFTPEQQADIQNMARAICGAWPRATGHCVNHDNGCGAGNCSVWHVAVSALRQLGELPDEPTVTPMVVPACWKCQCCGSYYAYDRLVCPVSGDPRPFIAHQPGCAKLSAAGNPACSCGAENR